MTWKQSALSEKSKIIRTIIAWIAFACFGASAVLPGTALLDLQIRMQESFAVASRIITFRAAGYFTGGILFGILEKYYNSNFSLTVSCSIFGISTILAPLMCSWIFMGSFTFLMGLGQAGFDMVVHLYLLQIWKTRASNPIQIMQMCFGIGGLIGPVIVRPLMLPLQSEIAEVFADDKHIKNIYAFSPDDVHVHWAFLLVGMCTLACAMSFLSFYLNDRKESVKLNKDSLEKEKQEEKTYSTSYLKETTAIVLAAVIAHLCVGSGALICSFTQAFGVKSEFHMAKKSAALLSVTFWVAYIGGRIIFVFLTLFIKEWKVMTVFISLGSTSLYFIFTAKSVSDIFIFLAIFGFGHAPVFGLLISIPSQYFTPTGRQTSIIFLSGIVGDALHPMIVSHYMDNHPEVFTLYLGILAVFTFILTALLPIVCKKLFKLVEPGSDKMPILAEEEEIGSGSSSDSETRKVHFQ